MGVIPSKSWIGVVLISVLDLLFCSCMMGLFLSCLGVFIYEENVDYLSSSGILVFLSKNCNFLFFETLSDFLPIKVPGYL